MDDKAKHVCSICGKEYDGYGNNAQPVNDGRCCDKCNESVVIPRRLSDLKINGTDETKKQVEDFLCNFYDIKYDMIKKAKFEEVRDINGPSDAFVDELFKDTSEKLDDLAKRKLNDRVMRGILFGYLGIVDDDIELIIALYSLVAGGSIGVIGIDLDALFN